MSQVYSTGVAVRGFLVSMASLLLGASVVHNIYNPLADIARSRDEEAGTVETARVSAVAKP